MPEHARTHSDVLRERCKNPPLTNSTNPKPRRRGSPATHPGVVCDTGDLVLRMWSEAVLDFSWHPLLPPNPRVDLHILCPTLPTWEEDPLRTLPRLDDRLALEEQYRAHLAHRHHLVAEGDTVEARLEHVMSQWPW